MRRAAAIASGLAVLAMVAALVALLPASSRAEQKLQQSPLILDLDAAAGDTLHERIMVTAPEDALVVEVGHSDFGFDTSDYHPVLISDDADETTAFSTKGWFSTPKKRYRVPAGASIDIPVKIKVPANTPGGTYTGAILVRAVPPSPGKKGAATVQATQQVATLVFISVAGGDPPTPHVRTFDVPAHATRGPLHPRIVVENKGDQYFSVGGTVNLKGAGTDKTIHLRDDQRVVPDQPRELTGARPGDTTSKGDRLVLGGKHLKPGRYTVTARLHINPTGKKITITRTVWVVPVWLWLIAAISVAALVAAIVVLVRQWRSPTQAPATEPPVEDEIVEGELDDDELSEDELEEDNLDEASFEADSFDEDVDESVDDEDDDEVIDDEVIDE